MYYISEDCVALPGLTQNLLVLRFNVSYLASLRIYILLLSITFNVSHERWWCETWPS